MAHIYAHTHECVNNLCASQFANMGIRDYSDVMSTLIASKIIRLRHAKQLTQKEFAKLFGVNQGSISRWEKGSMPEPENLCILASLAGVSIQEFIGIPLESGVIPMGEMVEVRGSVAAGLWHESWEWPEEDRFGFSGSLEATLVKAPHRFGLRVDGESMNLRYPPGTLLDCVSVFALENEPTNGQRVIVERRSHDGTVEATVKKLVIGEDGQTWLIAESSRPEYQAPIKAFGTDSLVAETRIIAVVVGSYRLE